MPHLYGGFDMKTNRLYYKLILLLALAAVSFGCEKKDLTSIDQLDDLLFVHATYTINFNSAWDNEKTPYLNVAADYNVRYTLEFWTMDADGNKDKLVVRKQIVGSALGEGNNSQIIKVDLPGKKLKALVWADLVKKGETDNSFFDVSDLTPIKMLSIGFNKDKDAFSNAQDLDYTIYAKDIKDVDVNESITLLRPFACYNVVANDYEKYITEKGNNAPLPVFTNIAYQLWIPTQYNAFTQKPQGATVGLSYKYTSGPLDNELYPLASDMVFVGTADTDFQYYNLIAAVYDANSVLIATSANVEAKILRNKLTYIYGPFITTSNIGTSGIDDSFDDHIDVVIPD